MSTTCNNLSTKGAPLPEGDTSFPTKLTETGASLLQSFTPLKNICAFANAFHLYADDPTRTVEANHYCAHVTDDIRQCLIYDSHDKSHARLIGVEYMISKELFENLPEEEKKYWHSHHYEVVSGMLITPGLPTAMEDMEMKKLGCSYGKTWHFWQVDRGDPLPYGPAKLMGAFTKDGQLDPSFLIERDKKFGISTEEKRKHRQEYKDEIPLPDPKADRHFGFENLK